MQRLRATNLSTAGHALRDSARTSSSKFSAREGYGKASTRTSLRRSYRACSKLSVPSEGEMEPVSPLLMKALQTKRRPVEAPAHISTGTGLADIGTGTGLTPPTSAPGLGSQRHIDTGTGNIGTRTGNIGTGTGSTASTSAPDFDGGLPGLVWLVQGRVHACERGQCGDG